MAELANDGVITERRFKGLVEAVSSYAIFMLDMRGNVASWNAGAERIKGYKADEIIGEHFSVFYMDEDRQAGLPMRELAAAAAEGKFEHVGWRVHKDGRRFWANAVIDAIYEPDGALVGYVKVIRDITAQRGLEDRFRQVVESAPNAMVMIGESGLIEMVNAQAEQMFGYAREELLDQKVEMLVPERFRHGHPKLRATFFEDPRSRPMGAGRDLYGLKKDGGEFPIEIGLNPIETDEAVKVLSAIVDISSRKQLENRFRQVVESAPNAMVMVDPMGQIAMVNAQAEKMFGYDRAELLHQSIEMLVPARFRARHPELRTNFFSSPAARPMGVGRDLYGLRKDGSEFPIEIGLNPIETDEGQMVLSAIVDISGRKQLEERFRQVVESAPNAMVMIAASGRIVMVNAQAEGVFGYDRAELLDQPVEILVPERFRGQHPGLRTGFFDRPESRPMGVGRDLYGLKKDGSEFPIEIGLNPIETEDGPMVLSAIVDISSRKRLEERFRRVVEAAPNAMVMIGPTGRIEMVNAQAERVFGYERAEMLGQSIEFLVPERFRGHHPGLRTAFFADPHSRPMGAGRDLYGLAKDGSEFPVEIGLNPIETDEGPMVLSAIVDISDRKQKEERIQAALREKDTLLGEIHHRVKNNLQVVHSLLDLQGDLVTDEKILGILRESQNRIKSMALIHQTLYESKDFVQVDFSTFLESLAPTLISSYGMDAERVSLVIEAAEVLLPINAAIPCGLVVNELISNALKHAFPAGRRGEIRIELAPEPDGRAMLSVSDDGVGIAEDYDLTRTTTLGLQLVALLTDQLGGEIEIQRSNPTRFILRFPIE